MEDGVSFNLSKGNSLVAHPFINDGWFRRTVVLMAEHNQRGSLGFVINKPAHLRLKDILPGFPDVIYPVFIGGPVADDQLFFLHRFPNEVEGSMLLSEGIYWGGDFKQLMRLIKRRVAGFNSTRFFMGYSGWEAGQLEREISEKAWFINKSDNRGLLHSEPENCWGDALKKMGSNYSVLADYPFEPGMN